MAREPYNPAPSVMPEAPPAPEERIGVPPQAFGSSVGAAQERAGGQLISGSDELNRAALGFAQMNAATEALDATTKASKDLGDAELEFRQLRGLNAAAGYPAFQQKVTDIQQRYADSISSPRARLSFLTDFRNYADRTLMGAGVHVADQSERAHLDALNASIAQEKSLVVSDAMMGRPPNFDKIVSRTAMVGQEMGAEKTTVDAMIQKNTGDAMSDVIRAQIARGNLKGAQATYEGSLKMTAPGTNLPVMDGDHLARIQWEITSAGYAQDARDARNERYMETHAPAILQQFRGQVYGSAVNQNEPPTPTQITSMVKNRIISPEMGTNLLVGHAVVDDPTTLNDIYAKARRGDDVLPAAIEAGNNGLLRQQTIDAIIKTGQAAQSRKDDTLEKAAFSTLRTIAGGDAVDKGMIDFGDEAHKAQIQLWGRAQAEWNQRVFIKNEDPEKVLEDMAPRYAHPVESIKALPRPRYGSINSLDDISAIAQRTQEAADAGDITEDQLLSEKVLILQYQKLLQDQQTRAAAAASAKPTLAPGRLRGLQAAP